MVDATLPDGRLKSINWLLVYIGPDREIGSLVWELDEPPLIFGVSYYWGGAGAHGPAAGFIQLVALSTQALSLLCGPWVALVVLGSPRGGDSRPLWQASTLLRYVL